MMFTLEEVKKAVGGRLVSRTEEIVFATSLEITGVSTDTRTIKEGELFVALKGENFDGNDYLAKAMELGAAALITDDIVNYTDDNNVLRSKDFYESIFGDLNKIKSSDKNPKHLIDNCRDIPDIYMACGVDDFLYGKNVDFHEFLKSREINATFVEAEGEHTWEFCDKYLKEFIKTLL